MASNGPPGVSSPHPSLPARPPPSTTPIAAASSITPTLSASSTPPITYGPSAPPTASSTPSYYGASAAALPSTAADTASSQPKLGYSRTYATADGAAGAVGAGAGRGRGGYNSYYTNSKYPQQQQAQGPNYGPSLPAGGAAAATYGPQYPQAGAQYGPHYGAQATYQAAPQYGSQYGTQYGPQAGPQDYAASAPPAIRNPFPAEGHTAQASGAGRGSFRQNASNYASWQSGYTGGQDASAAAGGAAAQGQAYGPSYGPTYGPSYGQAYGPSYGPTAPVEGAPIPDAAAAANTEAAEGGEAQKKKDRQKTVYRQGGGKKWADDTLLEWDPSHLRLFVGNLAGEVTDETLLKSFGRWRSVQKAVVKRDKWTKKSRGYGFVSFSDADDFFQAAKEMNGKYIGSHPVVVRKSTTEIKVSTFKDESGGKRNKKHAGHGGAAAAAGAGGTTEGALDKGAQTSGTNTPIGPHVKAYAAATAQAAAKKSAGSGMAGKQRSGYEPALGPVSTGVHKPGKKKNGLKLLG